MLIAFLEVLIHCATMATMGAYLEVLSQDATKATTAATLEVQIQTVTLTLMVPHKLH